MVLLTNLRGFLLLFHLHKNYDIVKLKGTKYIEFVISHFYKCQSFLFSEMFHYSEITNVDDGQTIFLKFSNKKNL
jgi:hypothetical protein